MAPYLPFPISSSISEESSFDTLELCLDMTMSTAHQNWRLFLKNKEYYVSYLEVYFWSRWHILTDKSNCEKFTWNRHLCLPRWTASETVSGCEGTICSLWWSTNQAAKQNGQRSSNVNSFLALRSCRESNTTGTRTNERTVVRLRKRKAVWSGKNTGVI